MFRRRLLAFLVLGVALALPGIAQAQQARNDVVVNYFSNAHNSSLPDAEVNITNTAATVLDGNISGVGNLIKTGTGTLTLADSPGASSNSWCHSSPPLRKAR